MMIRDSGLLLWATLYTKTAYTWWSEK